jgi:hypothetical protein
MDLYVKIDEGFYLNPASGEVRTQARKSIPLSAPISVRKMKPSLKYVKKIGDVWIGSNKISFALLLAYVQLKQGKNTVIGLYKHGDRYFWMEGSVDIYKQSSLLTGLTDADETPDVFMSVRGKVYDSIFGTAEIRNAEFDFVKAYRDFSQVLTPLHLVVAVLCLSIAGYFFASVFHKPPKVEVPKIVKRTPPPPPPLTPGETSQLLVMLKDKFIEKYSEVQREISGSGHEKWLKSVTLTTAPTPDRESIAVSFTYASYYPFEGAKQDGNEYSWTRPYGESFSRENLKSFSASPVGAYVCLKYLIHYPVSERTGNKWTVSLKENKYPKIAFLLNLIYNCPCAIKDMRIDDKGLSGTVVLNTM